MRIYLKEKVTTIANNDDRISRVAVLLKQFMKECNDPNLWDARTSRAEVGGFMRAWARKIIEEVK